MNKRELDSVFGDNAIARPGKEGVSQNGFTDLPEGVDLQSVGGANSSDRITGTIKSPAERPASRRPGETPAPYTRAHRNSKPDPHGHCALQEFRRPKGNGPCYNPGFPEPGRWKARNNTQGGGSRCSRPLTGLVSTDVAVVLSTHSPRAESTVQFQWAAS